MGCAVGRFGLCFVCCGFVWVLICFFCPVLLVVCVRLLVACVFVGAVLCFLVFCLFF